MEEIHKIEWKRIFGNYKLIIIFLLFFVISIYSLKMDIKKYSRNQVTVDYLKIANTNVAIDDEIFHQWKIKYPRIEDPFEEISMKDISPVDEYLCKYFSETYSHQNIKNSSSKDFYENRISIIMEGAKRNPSITHSKLKYIKEHAESLRKPLITGYSEGWKNIYETLGNYLVLILIVNIILINLLVSEDREYRVEEIIQGSQKGRKELLVSRLFLGFKTTTLIYLLGISFFVLIKILYFGFDGWGLPIQSIDKYFYSILNITIGQGFILNLFLGYIANLMGFLISFLFSIFFKDIVTGRIVTGSFFISMLLGKNIYYVSWVHDIFSFLPMGILEFEKYYIENELYSLGNIIIPFIVMAPIIGIALSILVYIVIHYGIFQNSA